MKNTLAFTFLVSGLFFSVGAPAEEKDKVQEGLEKEEKPFRQPFKLDVPLKDKKNEKSEAADEKGKKEDSKKR